MKRTSFRNLAGPLVVCMAAAFSANVYAGEIGTGGTGKAKPSVVQTVVAKILSIFSWQKTPGEIGGGGTG